MAQPLLHDAIVTLRAPSQTWTRPDGSMREPIDGVYVSDVRIVSGLEVVIAGSRGELIACDAPSASDASSVLLLRVLDDPAQDDPDVRAEVSRCSTASGAAFRIRVRSRRDIPLTAPVAVRLVTATDPMSAVRIGEPSSPVAAEVDGERVTWAGEGVTAALAAPGARIASSAGDTVLAWALRVPPRGTVEVAFEVTAEDADAVVESAPGPAPWEAPDLGGADPDLARWVDRALGDLDALRMRRRGSSDAFLAAGAPWFFTLFGRDSIWAARLLLGTGGGVALAASTLRALAGLQGDATNPETAEQPGKIMHELRRSAQTSGDVTLPPLYYGTVDATPLWVCLLAEARRAGLPDSELEALLPALDRALDWMRGAADAGGGFLAYLDESGHGLSNQGWKDSSDSVQWRDGRLAGGPIALCEVQAYAHEAALGGADLLDAAGRDGGPWRDWAAALRTRFAQRFWVSDPDGRYPAIALDARGRPVDSLTSNIGHLLGTGILDPAEERLVAARLVSPELSSGLGVRTMSTRDAGYWPLSYHGGSVWAHDTAIAIRGLLASGFSAEARELASGLVAAAASFGYRMPELYAGDPRDASPHPIPYPAACRPQAWSAAAALTAATALSPDQPRALRVETT